MKIAFFVKTQRATWQCCLFFLASIAFCACDNLRVTEQHADMPDATWHYDSAAVLSFDVADTSLTYNLYYAIRHNQDYPYYNLYVRYKLSDANEKVLRSGILESNLMLPLTGEPIGEVGKPIGKGIGVSFTSLHPILLAHRFEQPGTYKLMLRQYMRPDNLQGIYSVGMRLEKTEK